MLRTRRGGRRRAVIGRSRPSFGRSRSRLSESPSSVWGRGCPVWVPSGTGLLRGVAVAAIGRTRPSLGPKISSEPVAMLCIAGLCLGWRLPGSCAERHRARGRMFSPMICNRSASRGIVIRRIAGLCGAAGHSNRGFAQLQGGGRRAELSEMAGQKTVGVSQGGEAPLAAFFAYFLSHHRK